MLALAEAKPRLELPFDAVERPLDELLEAVDPPRDDLDAVLREDVPDFELVVRLLLFEAPERPLVAALRADELVFELAPPRLPLFEAVERPLLAVLREPELLLAVPFAAVRPAVELLRAVDLDAALLPELLDAADPPLELLDAVLAEAFFGAALEADLDDVLEAVPLLIPPREVEPPLLEDLEAAFEAPFEEPPRAAEELREDEPLDADLEVDFDAVFDAERPPELLLAAFFGAALFVAFAII